MSEIFSGISLNWLKIWALSGRWYSSGSWLAQGFKTGGCRLPLVSLNEEEKVTLAQHLGLKDDALMHELPLDLGKEVEEND